MATKAHLYLRTSHKYRDGWAHLDSREYVATVRLTAPRLVARPSDDADHSEGPTYAQWARLPSGADPVRVAQALRDTMGGGRCHHEYDCCGCASRYVTVTRKTRRDLLVRVEVSYNY